MTDLSALPLGATLPSPMPTAVAAAKDAEPQDRPDYERPALSRMREKWRLPDLLLGGTPAMQKEAVSNRTLGVLPREPDEDDDEHDRRVRRTVLTNYYGKTLDTHSGKPFAQQVKFEPALPEKLAYLETDADGTGKSFTVFARDLLHDAMHRGLAHVLVDIPRGPAEDFGETLRRRARLVHIGAGALLDVRESPSADGQERVGYARIRQERSEPHGMFGTKCVDTILEIATETGTAAYSREWVRVTDDNWLPQSEEKYTRDSVPLFTLYTKQTGDHEAEPAYGYLAELNLAHFQSDADQRHALSYGRRATLVQTGWKKKEDPTGRAAHGPQSNQRDVMGYGRKMRHDNDGANAFLLETNGAPLAAGAADLKQLEERMERFGADQISKGGGITATSRQIDDKNDTCNLEAWCTREENMLLNALRAAAEWIDVELPKDQRILIPREWAEGPKQEQVPVVLQLRDKGVLSRETTLREVHARGMLVTVKNVDDELERLAQEDAERTAEDEAQRMIDAAIAARGAPGAEQQDGAEPADENEEDGAPGMSKEEVELVNKFTLGIERLSGAGDTELTQGFRQRLAELLSLPKPRPLKVAPRQPAPAPSRQPPVGAKP